MPQSSFFDDPRGAALQEAVGEASGGGPEVDAVPACRVDAECVQGVRELLAAARDESRRPLDLERDVLADLLPRLLEAGHEAGKHERLRLRPALGEPSLHEHDVEAPAGIEPQPDGSVEVEGAVTIRDLNRACDWTLPDEEANTIAGLVIHEAQAIPSEGQVFSFHGFRFEVLGRENNRLTRLRLRKLA